MKVKTKKFKDLKIGELFVCVTSNHTPIDNNLFMKTEIVEIKEIKPSSLFNGIYRNCFSLTHANFWWTDLELEVCPVECDLTYTYKDVENE